MLLRERRPMPAAQQLLRAAGPCRVLSDADVIALTEDSVDMLGAIEPGSGPTVTISSVCVTRMPPEGMAATTMPSEFYDELVEVLPIGRIDGTPPLNADLRSVSFPGTTPLVAEGLPRIGDTPNAEGMLKSEHTPAIGSSHTDPRWSSFPSPLPSLTSALSRRAALFGAVTATGLLTVSGAAAAAKEYTARAADAEIVDLADRIKQLCIECDRLTDQRATIEDRVTTEGPRRPEPPPTPPSRTNIVHHDTTTERVMTVSMPLDPDPAVTEWEQSRDAAKKAFNRDRAAMEESLGLPEVCNRFDRLWMRLQDLTADMSHMEPQTSVGLAAKAAVVVSIDSVGALDDWGVDLALALATDAVRLCGMGGVHG